VTNPSATQDSYPYQNEPIWSRSEKAIARKAFDAALGRELHEVIQEAKRMANEIQQSSDLWDLEHYLTQRRKEIDRKYARKDPTTVKWPVLDSYPRRWDDGRCGRRTQRFPSGVIVAWLLRRKRTY